MDTAQVFRIYLGLGSNIEPRLENLTSAIRLLKKAEIKVVRQSSIYETSPWGYLDQADFLNMVVEAETRLTPGELLPVLKQIEQDMGRKRTIKNGPRNIDIDILIFGKIRLESPRLNIPHPSLSQRQFVLAPLCDLIPDMVLPGMTKTVRELYRSAGSDLVKLWSEPHG